jgi:hypothetical protein
MPRFVVIVGDPADGSSAFRIENPARLLRVWSLLRATRACAHNPQPGCRRCGTTAR